MNNELPIIACTPKWSDGINVSFKTSTVIVESLSGVEDRTACQARPLVSMRYTALNLTGEDSSYWREVFEGRGERAVGVPLWMDMVHVGSVNASTNVFPINTRCRLYPWFKKALVWQDGRTYEIVEIDCGDNADETNLKTAVLNEYTDAYLIPLVYGRMLIPDSEYLSGDVSEVRVEFDEIPQPTSYDEWIGSVIDGDFDSSELDIRPDWANEPEHGAVDDLFYEPIAGGVAVPQVVFKGKRRSFRFGYKLNRELMQRLLRLFDNKDGCRGSFKVSTWLPNSDEKVEVRFRDDELAVRCFNPDLFSVDVNLVEVDLCKQDGEPQLTNKASLRYRKLNKGALLYYKGSGGDAESLFDSLGVDVLKEQVAGSANQIHGTDLPEFSLWVFAVPTYLTNDDLLDRFDIQFLFSNSDIAENYNDLWSGTNATCLNTVEADITSWTLYGDTIEADVYMQTDAIWQDFNVADSGKRIVICVAAGSDVQFFDAVDEYEYEQVESTLDLEHKTSYLYRCKIGTEESLWCNWQHDLQTIDSANWTAGDITHGEVEHSEEMFGEEIELACNGHFRDELLRGVVSNKTIEVEILKIGLLDGDSQTPEIIFSGVVVNTEVGVNGEVRALLSSKMRVLERGMPKMKLQRQCNWRLYSSECGVNCNASKKVVNVLYVEPKKLRISTTTDADERFFVGGVFEYGGRKYVILGDAEENSHRYLRLDSPIPVFNGNQSVTIIPWCDKTIGCCQNKFNNVANFGGCPYLPNNNPAEQVSINESVGGKK